MGIFFNPPSITHPAFFFQVLRVSRFFPEEDDLPTTLSQENLKANEFLYRRVDRRDILSAIFCALQNIKNFDFEIFIISSPSPFMVGDCTMLASCADEIAKLRIPEYHVAYEKLGWKMIQSMDRIYDSEKARKQLGWVPRYDFNYHLKTNFVDIFGMEPKEFDYHQ
eukprot:TRINITY_DN3904_c0_g1_i12.p1 TRINITY_DN3904_c0_g1~~TRINITY_DN3904_c0_g1_i12.p1  ORF type:complete len:166 (+),score=40.21 TRINITY_DN3904_c0_g1_i12:812-1309(+)